MKYTVHKKTYPCAFDASLDVIGGKWKMGIIWHLGDGTLRFGGLERVLPGVNAKTLTLQLRELEEDGIITRTAYPEVPLRVEYRLTDLGRTLIPVLQSLCDWGTRYLDRENGDGDPARSGMK